MLSVGQMLHCVIKQSLRFPTIIADLGSFISSLIVGQVGMELNADQITSVLRQHFSSSAHNRMKKQLKS